MKFFLPALALLFIGLKLTGYIAWSWWLVLLPLWGGLAVALVFVIVWAILLLVGTGRSRIRFK